MKRSKLYEWLRTNKWLYTRPGVYGELAYQQRIEQGYMVHKVTTRIKADGDEIVITQPRVTPKGIVKLAKEFGVTLPAQHDLFKESA